MEPMKIKLYATIIKQALTIRLVEEKLLRLFSEGKLFGTVHTCIGQEFVGVSVGHYLRSDDYIFSNHRCHGHFLSCGGTIEGLIAEIMGKPTGVCSGKGGSQHLHHDRFFSNGVQGGIVPVAAGLAFSQKLNQTPGIGIVFLGDGTLGEGVIYETMNIASKWNLPLLFVLENNLYAQSTHQSQTLAGNIGDRFRAFGIESTQSDTWHWEALLEDMAGSMKYVRATGKPRFHQVDTYRLKAHSKGDDNRSPEEVQSYWERDPLSKIMEEHGQDELLREMISEINMQIDCAVKKAEEVPFFKEVKYWNIGLNKKPEWEERPFEKERILNSIYHALDEAMSSNNKIILLGEDIEGPYGGAFKVTQDLSQRHEQRVHNTPISEAALVGIGSGLALSGFLPVIEIMFGDFMMLAADQWVNHAAKFRYMYNNQVSVPLIVRTPMGGNRGYGPTHSQCLEKHFLGIPQTKVLCLHHRYSPYLLYRDLLQSIDKPTLVIENKTLYANYTDPKAPTGYQLCHSKDQFPITWLRSTSPADVTMMAIGGMCLEAEKAAIQLFEEEEIIADLFFPSQLYPFDIGALESSLSNTKRLLVVEEGQRFASFSSEVVAQVAERFPSLNVKSRRLAAKENPIPASRPLEEYSLPSVNAIVQTILEMVSD